MPMPKPKKNETQKEFIGRFMADAAAIEEYPDEKQRYAVAMDEWKKFQGEEFAGFDDHIEIFKGGRQTDSSGKTHDGDALIDKAVASFDPSLHEPPVVIGHPADNAPAYGWVESLKTGIKDGVKVLLARFRQVVPEFEEAVKTGRYKKRSAAFYPDGSLRHVGFLGAMPPAVKGLADVAFREKAGPVFEFAEPAARSWRAIAEIFRKFREYLIEKDGSETADRIVPEYTIRDLQIETEKEIAEAEEAVPAAGFSETLNKGGAKMTFKERVKGLLTSLGIDVGKIPDDAIPDQVAGAGRAFSEADIEKIKKASEEAGAKKVQAEFAEKARQEAKAERDREIAAWCGQRIKEGKLVPAWVEGGLVNFMQNLDAENAIAFSESKKENALAWFKNFLETFGASPLFKEMAAKGKGASEFSEAQKQEELGKSIANKVNPKA